MLFFKKVLYPYTFYRKRIHLPSKKRGGHILYNNYHDLFVNVVIV